MLPMPFRLDRMEAVSKRKNNKQSVRFLSSKKYQYVAEYAYIRYVYKYKFEMKH